MPFSVMAKMVKSDYRHEFPNPGLTCKASEFSESSAFRTQPLPSIFHIPPSVLPPLRPTPSTLHNPFSVRHPPPSALGSPLSSARRRRRHLTCRRLCRWSRRGPNQQRARTDDRSHSGGESGGVEGRAAEERSRTAAVVWWEARQREATENETDLQNCDHHSALRFNYRAK